MRQMKCLELKGSKASETLWWFREGFPLTLAQQVDGAACTTPVTYKNHRSINVDVDGLACTASIERDKTGNVDTGRPCFVNRADTH